MQSTISQGNGLSFLIPNRFKHLSHVFGKGYYIKYQSTIKGNSAAILVTMTYLERCCDGLLEIQNIQKGKVILYRRRTNPK